MRPYADEERKRDSAPPRLMYEPLLFSYHDAASRPLLCTMIFFFPRAKPNSDKSCRFQIILTTSLVIVMAPYFAAEVVHDERVNDAD